MEFKYQDNKFGKTLLELKKAVKGTKYENHVFLVGGAVRDGLLGKEMKDIDLAIDLPNGGVEFAEWVCKEYGCFKENSNPCLFPTYGTAKFSLKSLFDLCDVEIECVQTRKEQYKDKESRKPETVFGSIEDDAKRRDLTINALYVNISTDIIVDPNKVGLDDLHNSVIRTTSEPDIIFDDDPLRMLRVIRFATKLGWGIERNTWLGIIKNIGRIDIVSKERISDELTKILLCDKPSVGIVRLEKCGLLEKVLPSVHDMVGVKQNTYHFGDVFEHTMSVIDKTAPSKITRWAGLLHDAGKPKASVEFFGMIKFLGHEIFSEHIVLEELKRLKFSNSEISSIAKIVRYHMQFKQNGKGCPSVKSLRKFIDLVGEENLHAALNVINADNNSHSKWACAPKQVELIYKRLEEMKEQKTKIIVDVPINGNDIMKTFNLKPSKKIGEILEKVKEYVIGKETDVTKEECIEFIKANKLIEQ